MRAVTSWSPAVLWATALLALSSLESIALPRPSFPHMDKVGHFGLYAVLGATLAWGWAWSDRTVPGWLLLLLGSTFGALDELYQHLTPGRMPSIGDWIADVAGLLCGFLFVAGLLRSRMKDEDEVGFRHPPPRR